jgi:hypothetical protein
MKGNRTISELLLLLIISVICQPATGTQQNRANKERIAATQNNTAPYPIEEVLWWLPEDTETVSVVRGPFKVSASAEPSESMSPADFVELALSQEPLGGLGVIKDGVFLKQFVGHTVSLCVEGGRRFRAPTSLGGMRFEGCDIIILQQDFAERTALLNRMASQAKVFHNLEGQRVAEFEERLEQDIWKVFVAMPAPNILLLATNRDFLSQVLSRMYQRASIRALPETLPEWKHVNTGAKFWALRHYDKAQAQYDPSSPLSGQQAAAICSDAEAVGVVFDFDPARSKVAAVRYLSRDEKGLKSFSDDMKKNKNLGQDFKPQFRQTKPGIIEMTVSLDENEQAGMFLFVVLMLLGHGVFV